MNRLVLLLAAVMLCCGVPHRAFAQVPGVDELRGFTTQNFDDLERLSQSRERAGDTSIKPLLELLSIGDLDDLPGITDAVIAQVRLNRVFLQRTRDMKSMANAARTYTAVAEPVTDGKYFRQTQASRAELMKMASRALRGDGGAFATLSAIGQRVGARSHR